MDMDQKEKLEGLIANSTKPVSEADAKNVDDIIRVLS